MSIRAAFLFLLRCRTVVLKRSLVRYTLLLYKVRGVRERNLIRARTTIISNTELVLYGWWVGGPENQVNPLQLPSS